MFCNYCGSENVNDAKFCNSCGKNIQPEPVNSAPDVINKLTLEDDKSVSVESNQSDIDKNSSKTTISMSDTVEEKRNYNKIRMIGAGIGFSIVFLSFLDSGGFVGAAIIGVLLGGLIGYLFAELLVQRSKTKQRKLNKEKKNLKEIKEQEILTSEESVDIVDILTNLVNFKGGKISRKTYVLNHIPIDKLDNAVKAYVPEKLSDNPIILHDESLGSSKTGFILTTKYFYCCLSKEGSYKKVKYAIPLNKITSIELKPDINIISSGINIIINNNEVGQLIQFDKKDIENICFVLKQLIKNSDKLKNIPLDLFKHTDKNKWIIEKDITPLKKEKTEKNIFYTVGKSIFFVVIFLVIVGIFIGDSSESSQLDYIWNAHLSKSGDENYAQFTDIKGEMIKKGTVSPSSMNTSAKDRLPAYLACYTYVMILSGIGDTESDICVYLISNPTRKTELVRYRGKEYMSHLESFMAEDDFKLQTDDIFKSDVENNIFDSQTISFNDLVNIIKDIDQLRLKVDDKNEVIFINDSYFILYTNKPKNKIVIGSTTNPPSNRDLIPLLISDWNKVYGDAVGEVKELNGQIIMTKWLRSDPKNPTTIQDFQKLIINYATLSTKFQNIFKPDSTLGLKTNQLASKKESKNYSQKTSSTPIATVTRTYEDGLSAKFAGPKKIIGLYFNEDKDKDFWSGCDNPIKERVKITSVTIKDQNLITEFNTNATKWGRNKSFQIILSSLPNSDRWLSTTLIKKGAIVNITARGCGSGYFPTAQSIENI